MKTEGGDDGVMRAIGDPKDFDRSSGSGLERLIFNNRWLIVLGCLIATVVFGWQSASLKINASFEKMIPQSHPYIKNYTANIQALKGLGNSVRVVVEHTKGDIYDPAYLETVRKVNDTIFLMPGVDRAYMKSLWTPVVRWNEITEEGFRGGPVMPDRFDGSAARLAELRTNVFRSGIVGSIVASDQRSSMVFVPLLDKNVQTGAPLDYAAFSRDLESKIRTLESGSVRIHIIGFAKLAGDLIDGLVQVVTYFVVAGVIAALLIYWFTRCMRSTSLVLLCSVVAVIWELGVLELLGYSLDPYTVLVPFLVFAIGVSHGAQKMNGIMQDIGRGTDKYVAARYTFRRLFLPGLTALLADVVGFAVLMIIDIPVIRELAVAASIGVAMLVFTNLVLLPILLSFSGVTPSAALRSLRDSGLDTDEELERSPLLRFTQRPWAICAIAGSVVLTVAALVVSQDLQVGDLDAGAPELRAQSRYNQDNAYITSHFALSSDLFAVFVKTQPDGIGTYETLLEMDRLEQRLRALPGVQTTTSASSLTRQMTAAYFEGTPKWMSLSRDVQVLGSALTNTILVAPELLTTDRSLAPIVAYLVDHRAETLSQVVDTVEKFAAEHDSPDRQFLLAAGSAGIEAATNIVVHKANREMLFLVYAAVIALCFVTFFSWRAVLVAVIPLVMTSILCEALMVMLGIGVKVATLPVIALGVGIGVDYALYLLSVIIVQQKRGKSLGVAYVSAMKFTGKVVVLVGVTLAIGVVTWVFSPIKFQADMGILLTFMFLWNMIGALLLIPALAHFLLQDKQPRLETEASRQAVRPEECKTQVG